MALTDLALKALKPTDRDLKKADGKGLFILVKPSGAKLWRLAYRYGGKQKLLAFGAYPEVSIAEARKRRDEARVLLRDGIDPSAHRQAANAAKKEAAAHTFDFYADELLALLEKKGSAPRTTEKSRWLLSLARPRLGSRLIAEIRPSMVKAVLMEVQNRGHLETARRLRFVIGRVARLAQSRDIVMEDPTKALREDLDFIGPEVEHRAAITDPLILGEFLRAAEGFTGQPTTKAALQLMALLFQRPGELRFARWSEFDLEAATWTIPSERMKMKRNRDRTKRPDHVVFLPRQAVQILTNLRKVSREGDLVFPSTRSAAKPLSENTLNAALRRLGFTKDDATAHGFRATASTLLNESGKWSPDAIERALAHMDEDEVRRRYARGAYREERIKMAQWWADYLDTLRDGAKVPPFSKSAG